MLQQPSPIYHIFILPREEVMQKIRRFQQTEKDYEKIYLKGSKLPISTC